jgi:DNA mismatch repair protein MutL
MSRELANRIAAGEVVERPSSVVKELVENAIDSGASRISVTIEKSGSKLISVTDNGCGMDREDALLALETHGTSKLTDDADLMAIGTLGFRGEAIPSIASVSRFTLKTRRKEDREGTKIEVEAGILKSNAPTGGAAGTTVEVRDLFFNVPARKKFLKSPATEEHHIEEVMVNLALGHWEQSFELRVDRKLSFSSAGSQDQKLRIMELFGRSFAKNLLPVEYRENNVVISGFIAAPGFTRPARREQRVFVNRRAVESMAVWRGIRDGYGTLDHESGRFPPVILNISVPPEELDVNVHPAKREVRFKSEYSITRCVSSAVSAALRRNMQLPEELPESSPTLPSGISVENILDAAMVNYAVKDKVQEEFFPQKEQPAAEPGGKEEYTVKARETTPYVPEKDPVDDFLAKTPYGIYPLSQIELPKPADGAVPLKREEKLNFGGLEAAHTCLDFAEHPSFAGNWPTEVLGIWSDSYILCNSNSGMVIVDQHAAHERVLFEKILKAASEGSKSSQLLLIPQSLNLRSSEHRLIFKNREVFEKLGFEFEDAGGNTILISAVPADLAPVCRPVEEMIPDMLEELLMRQNNSSLAVDLDAAARAACHNAIRANDRLTLQEAANLIEEMKKCNQGTMCPHGRPTMITITKLELEKRFKRR